MNFAFKSVALATVVAATQIAGVAYAQAAKAPAAPVVQPAPTKAMIPTKAPKDWIIYDDTSYTPVLDELSVHLDAARKAFDAKDNKKAAQELRAVAGDLKQQAARAGTDAMALMKTDSALLAADMKYAQDTVKRKRSEIWLTGQRAPGARCVLTPPRSRPCQRCPSTREIGGFDLGVGHDQQPG